MTNKQITKTLDSCHKNILKLETIKVRNLQKERKKERERERERERVIRRPGKEKYMNIINFVNIHWRQSLLYNETHCYVTAHSPTFPSLHLHYSSFSNPSVALPTSQLIFQPFRRFTYFTTHSPTIPSLYLRYSSFSKRSVASPMPQLILQPFFRFSYVTGSSLSPWRAAHICFF